MPRLRTCPVETAGHQRIDVAIDRCNPPFRGIDQLKGGELTLCQSGDRLSRGKANQLVHLPPFGLWPTVAYPAAAPSSAQLLMRWTMA